MLSPDTANFTLISHLTRRQDSAMWARFVAMYGKNVQQWCVSHGLSGVQARQVVDDLLLRFWRQTDRFPFESDRSFRVYLREMTRLAWTDWKNRYRPSQASLGALAALGLLKQVVARDDLQRRLERAFETEIYENAMRQVKPRIEPQAWEAFRLLALEHRSGLEAAAILGMGVHITISDHNKIQRLIREEALNIEQRGLNS